MERSDNCQVNTKFVAILVGALVASVAGAGAAAAWMVLFKSAADLARQATPDVGREAHRGRAASTARP